MSCRSCTKVPRLAKYRNRNMLGVYYYPGKKKALSTYEAFIAVSEYQVALWGVIRRLQDIQRSLHQVVHLGVE